MKISSSFSVLLLIFLFCLASCSLTVMTLVSSQGYPTIPMKSDLRLHPFTQIPVPDYAIIDGATIRVDTNYVEGSDKLFFDYQGDFHIYNTFDSKAGVLYLAGTAPITEYLDAISSVVFYTTANDFQPRRITWTLGRGTFYNVLTRHFYRFVPGTSPTAGTGIGWNSARFNCKASNFLGMQGYLATITSYEEQILISTKTNMSLWIGLYASNSSDEWTWADGPEAGKLQYKGFSMYEGGVPAQGRVETAYTPWARFQPQNFNVDMSGANFVAAVPSLYEPVAWWKNQAETDGVQGYVCEYGGMDSPNITAQMPSWTGSVILEFACMNFTQGDCLNNANFGCVWNGRTCQQTTCRAYLTEKDCDGDFRCQWNTDITTTQIGRCAATRCSGYSDQQTCSLDVTCTTSLAYGTSRCLDSKCYNKLSSCHCAQNDGCVWHDGVCDNSQTMTCDNFDIVFVFDGTVAMDQNFLTYSGGYQGLVDLFQGADWATTRTPQSVTPHPSLTGQRIGFVRFGDTASFTPDGVGSWGHITGDYVEISTDLTYFQRGWVPSQTRNIRQALQKAQQMFASPDTVNRQKILVVLSAGAIADASGVDAQTALTTMRNAGVVVVGATLRPTQPATDRSNAAYNSLTTLMPPANIINTELDDFLSSVVYGICNEGSTLGKLVIQTSTAFQCSLIPNATACNKIGSCGWSYSSNLCVASHCLAHCSISECQADVTCTWDAAGSFCKEKCPGSTLGSCNSYSDMCSWDPTAAAGQGECQSFPCMNNPSEDACIADPYGCVYNQSAIIKCKPLMCQTTNMTKCESDWSNTCLSYNGQCFFDPCKVVGNNVTACRLNPTCQWGGTSAIGCIATACGKLRSERQCNFDFDCKWDITVSPAACMPATCTGYNKDPSTAPNYCAAMPSTCKYIPASNQAPARCELITCGMMTTSCDCSKLSQCVWRNEQCKDSRYVQCPSIDLVFLVEGSPVMNTAFGRHPNGFTGLIESIRSWSRDAPMTTNVSATGFRFGMVLYGAANTAQTVPDGVGNGNDVTGDPAQWLNAGQALDTMSEKQRSYSNQTAGQAAIWQGLEQSFNIFDKHKDETNRIKLLVVLGNSPITDGGRLFQGSPLVRQQIQKIEAIGVRIMANVIRRFSTITPMDLLSRQYMEPIASDPASTFFTFTTIDNMRKNLLDKFCDPSTNTGKLLKVSRDRTLPCSWLIGQKECNLQGSCAWNASAVPTCPLATQCANMGCVDFPPLIAKKFTCDQCKYSNGAFICSPATFNPPKRGMCLISPCMLSCQGSCNTNPACTFKEDKGRCERNWCYKYMDYNSCNQDSGCFWDEFDSVTGNVVPGVCKQGDCWAYRESGTCGAVYTKDAGGQRRQCIWRPGFSPAICEQRRCDYMDQTTCQLDTARCNYDSGLTGRKCQHLECFYTNADECEIDATCYWDPYKVKCMPRGPDCEISGFSKWTSCTATCGPKAIRYRVRKIVQFPADSADSIKCDVQLNNIAPPNNVMIQAQNCTDVIPNWPGNCGTYCNSMASLMECIEDMACQWSNGQCEAKNLQSCESKTSPADCNQWDSCLWDQVYQFCFPDVRVCQIDDSPTCAAANTCNWRRGPLTVQYGQNYGIDDVSLYNPGQEPMFVFPLLTFDQVEASQTYINGASVMIERGYALGKDRLDLKLPVSVNISWNPTQGSLILSGNATVQQYGYAIHFVTFQTTSTSSKPRLITWSLMNGTVYSGVTKHHYTRFAKPGLPWAEAKIRCEMQNIFGLQGYLATVTAEEENDIITGKLGGDGWIGADDKRAGTWSWVTGPEAGETFWLGACELCGGSVQPGMYANWDPLRRDPVTPVAPQQNNVYLNISGYWHSRFNEYPQAIGYVCEFGGQLTDVSPTFPTGGSTVFGPGGCMATPCVWHQTVANCTSDPDCQWANGQCSSGCNSRTSISECISSDRCFWNAQILPPICASNPCVVLGRTSCSTNAKCTWNTPSGTCILKTGCAAQGALVDCESVPTCMWYDKDGCVNRPCNTLTQQSSCMTNNLCKWVSGSCIDALCQYTDATVCAADKKCEWNQPNSISVGFTPGQGSIHPFANSGTFAPTDDSTIIDGITISITSGFQSGLDKLFLDPLPLTMATFKSNFNAQTGTLILTTFASAKLTPLSGFQMMQQYVSFSTTSSRRAPRKISYVLSANAVYSANSRAFFKSVNTNMPLGSRADAEGYCNTMNFFGLRGTLAQPATETDNLLIRSIKASGWMGARGVGGVWTWNQTVATPTNTTPIISYSQVTFWNYANGYGQPVPVTDPNSIAQYRFAAWGPSQPLAPATSTSVQTGFIIQDGTWISVVDGQKDLLPFVTCQFGNAAQTISVIVSASVTATPMGCFSRRCVSLLENQCKADPQCLWRGTTCVVDDWCSVDVPTPLSVTQCKQRAGCYWDYGDLICLAAPQSKCTGVLQTECNAKQSPGCDWNSKLLPQPGSTTSTNTGACVSSGCSIYPVQASCLADPLCRWYMPSSVYGSGACVERLCGYTSIESCFQDVKCQFDPVQSKCMPSVCLTETNCASNPQCTPSATVPGLCEYVRCAAGIPVGTATGRQQCLSDKSCLIINGKCQKPDCSKYYTEKSCNTDPHCFFFIDRKPGGVLSSRCDAAYCTMEADKTSCGGNQPSDPCRWTGTSCRQASPSEQVPTELCVRQIEPDMWWMYVLIAIIVLLLALIIWRLWIAYEKGISFLEPPRKTRRFDLAMYAADMFEDAKERDQGAGDGGAWGEDDL